MNGKPIGIFDSGLGGLTAVKELKRVLPHEDIIYFGDTGRVPYGNRSRETIVKYAMQDSAFLRTFGVKMLIAACGTVSSVATDVGKNLSIPFTGVVAPTCRAAARATKTGTIGVIGTTATIRSGAYRRELTRIDGGLRVLEQDCPLFVPLVENGFISSGDPITRLVVERYLLPLREAGVDALILGCTHYPILSEVIASVMGSGVALIDSGRETALCAADTLARCGLLNEREEPGGCSFVVSDRPEDFCRIAALFLGENVDRGVEQIDIEEY